MRIGLFPFLTDYSMPVHELAIAAEARGFDSLWVPEHTHIPVHRNTAYPGGGELPKEYSHTLDPFVALAAAAAVTKEIKLGTGICLLVERDTITTAKTVATLDHFSNGRVLFGIGAGWNREEMENHGANFANRWKIVREKVLAMKAIWRDDNAEFHGQFVNFDPIWSWPKPVQAGGPPIWLGANTKWTFDRVAEYCDGWMPIAGMGSGSMALLKAACEKRGRDVASIQLALFGAPTDETQLRGRIDQGFKDLVFSLPSEGPDKTLPRLDRMAALADKMRKG